MHGSRPEAREVRPPPAAPVPAPRVPLAVAALAAGLAAVAGAVDVLCITRLGEAFASIITGNTVVLGASLAQGDLRRLSFAATAIGAYVVGVVVGSLVTRSAVKGLAPWPARTTVVCAIEFAALAVMAGTWITSAGRPSGAAQYVALGAAATAMGLQSSAFRLVVVPGVTTTYFTGTLTGLLSGVVQKRKWNGSAAAALAALLAGAAASALLLVRLPRWAVLLPVVLLALVLLSGLAARLRRPPHGGGGDATEHLRGRPTEVDPALPSAPGGAP